MSLDLFRRGGSNPVGRRGGKPTLPGMLADSRRFARNPVRPTMQPPTTGVGADLLERRAWYWSGAARRDDRPHNLSEHRDFQPCRSPNDCCPGNFRTIIPPLQSGHSVVTSGSRTRESVERVTGAAVGTRSCESPADGASRRDATRPGSDGGRERQKDRPSLAAAGVLPQYHFGGGRTDGAGAPPRDRV